MNINWYPGHMKKTKELLKEQLKLIDVVFELLDARIPFSSQNPDIHTIIGNKPRVVILNKSDLADHEITEEWVQYFKEKNIKAIPVNTLSGQGLRDILQEGEKAVKSKMDALKNRGIKSRAVRVMIVGIPNVGKSSLINKLAGRKSAQTGDRPGITKGKQWIKLKGSLELLDTPGILWPRLEDPAMNLAFTGAIKDEIMDMETLALKLIEKLWTEYKAMMIERYDIKQDETLPIEIMNQIAKGRGCILKGGEIDYFRTANMFIDEFRSGKIGKISLERP